MPNSPSSLTPPSATPPNFSSLNTITLPYPLERVFTTLATSTSLEPVARLSGLCTSFTPGSTTTIAISPGLLSTTRNTQHLPASTSPSGLKRTSFTMEETIPVLSVFKNRVCIEGAQTEDWYGRCCLYESVAEKQGITIWKLRTFEEVEEGEGEMAKGTRVTERIEGCCPGWMRWIVERECARANKMHMEQYRTLFN